MTTLEIENVPEIVFDAATAVNMYVGDFILQAAIRTAEDVVTHGADLVDAP